ncbi:MAG: PEGA domain-containing protein [Kofleriaceae bacterium]
MRWSAGLVAVVITAATASAQPATAVDLRTEGEDLARRGQYAEAIEKFKAADRLEPHVQHACMIGLAYLRRGVWAQAELFLARCKQRAVAGGDLPEWFEEVSGQLAEGLRAAKVSTVTFVIKPASLAATMRVSGFAPDETFDPQTLHLPAGDHAITVEAQGHAPITKSVTLTGEHDTTELVFDFTAPVEPPRPPLLERVTERSPWGKRMLIAGGAATGAAIVLHAFAYRQKGKLEDARTDAEYADHETAFDALRGATLGTYAFATISLGVGLYLQLKEPETRVVVSVTPDSAFFGIGWRR